MTAANKKFRQLSSKVHYWKARDSVKDKATEEQAAPVNITTAEVICKHCGFKARYKFLRCPECNTVRKETKTETNKEENQQDATTK